MGHYVVLFTLVIKKTSIYSDFCVFVTLPLCRYVASVHQRDIAGKRSRYVEQLNTTILNQGHRKTHFWSIRRRMVAFLEYPEVL